VISKATTAALTITLNAPATAGTIELGNSGDANLGYTLSGSGTNMLTLNNSGTAATIIVTDGTHTIDAPVALADNLTVSGSGTLAFGASSSITGSGKSLTMAGVDGKLILSGTGGYTGGTIVSAGTLVLSSNTALPDGSSLTVGNAGAFPGPVVPAPAASPALAGAAPAGVTPVPEPGTLALLAAAAALFVVYRRRR
jgi:autotransporter-associated beta strand protein